MNLQVNFVSAFKLICFKPRPPRCINLVAALICMSLSGIATGDIQVGSINLQSSSTHNSASATQAAGSSVGGNSVLLSAGNNIQVTGSDVIGNTATTFIAKNDVTIEAAQSSFTTSNFSQTRESGLMSSGAGGIGFSIGNRNQSADAKGQGSSAVASTVGTIKGDLTIQAGGAYQQTGSDVLVPRGDANISAQSINVIEARETSQSTSTQKFEQSGITVSLSTPMLSTMQSVQSTNQTSGIKAGDGGFNVNVGGNTTLTGGVITSTQNAVDDKANSFQTGTGANGGTLTLKDQSSI